MYCSDKDNTKVFTLGIGSGCDSDLVRRMAEAGRGSKSTIRDGNSKQLQAKVIDALR